MIIDVPFELAPKLLKYEGISRILQRISLEQKVSLGSVVEKAGVSRKTAWRVLNNLLRTEHLAKEGRFFKNTGKILRSSILINLYDVETEDLFRWKITRRLLYKLCYGRVRTLKDLATMLNSSYDTVRAVVRNLRTIGLLCGKELNPDFTADISDPLELVPRTVHRGVMRHFLSALETYRKGFKESILLFGNASQGRQTLTLDVAVLFPPLKPEEMHRLAEDLTLSSSNVTAYFGATINLTMIERSVWLQIKLGLVKNVTPAISMIMDGICLRGQLPKDEDLFELGGLVSPRPEEEIRRLLRKGYIRRIDGGKYAYTEKAIERFREKKSIVTESLVRIDGKEIRLVGVAPPNRTY